MNTFHQLIARSREWLVVGNTTSARLLLDLAIQEAVSPLEWAETFQLATDIQHDLLASYMAHRFTPAAAVNAAGTRRGDAK